MILTGKAEELRKNFATLSTTSPTWSDPGANPSLHGEAGTNHLSHDTAFDDV
jgi:hypothetical protein